MNQELTIQNKTNSITTGFDTAEGFDLLQRIAKAFVNSTLVPKMYQATPDNPAAMGNCIIALNIANRIHADPMMVMQNLVIVQGRPSWSAKFLIATINASGRFSPLRFIWQGTPGQDDRGCKAVATDLSSGDVLEGPLITIGLARQEGWLGRNGSKWKSMPEKMTMYRAGAWWSDIYAPEMAMGLRTDEENMDAFDAEQNQEGTYQVKEINPGSQTKTEAILQKLKDKKPEPVIDETIDVQTGEIVDEEWPVPDQDEYEDLKRQISECKNKGQLAKLYASLPAEDKEVIKPFVKARQDEFNVIKEGLRTAVNGNKTDTEPPKTEPVEPELLDWETRIKAVKSASDLTRLLNSADESVELMHSALIDQMYDSFR